MSVQTVVPFVDLKVQLESIRDEVRAAVDSVFESTQFILGDAVEKFERERRLPVDGQISDRLVRELAGMTGRPLD